MDHNRGATEDRDDARRTSAEARGESNLVALSSWSRIVQRQEYSFPAVTSGGPEKELSARPWAAGDRSRHTVHARTEVVMFLTMLTVAEARQAGEFS